MTSRWTEDDLMRHAGKRIAESQPTPPRSKYRNVKVQVDGYTFDSKHEAQHYQELRLREKAGEISELNVHVVFELVTVQKDSLGPNWLMHINPIVSEYVADFVYVE